MKHSHLDSKARFHNLMPRAGLRLGAALAVTLSLAACSSEPSSDDDTQEPNDALMAGQGVPTTPGPTMPAQTTPPASSPQAPQPMTPTAAPMPTMGTPPTPAPDGAEQVAGGAGGGAAPPADPTPTPTMASGGAGGQGGAAAEPGDGGSTGDAGGAGGTEVGAGGSGGAPGSAGAGGAGDVVEEPGYQPCPESGPCKIMPFGDSITEGCCIFTGGYRVDLFRQARADGHEITFVGSVSNGPAMVDGVPFPQDHEGHGGYTIQGGNGIAQFVMPSLNAYEPDIITLMIGTNDINGNMDLPNAPRRLGELLDSIFDIDPDVLVVLAQIVPTQSDGTNQRVQEYNSAMPALVEERVAMGRNIILLDMYEAFTRDASYKNTLLGDNLHPNDAGYVRMAETWYEVIAPYLR